jgi:low affinity Fe/Cu permease
MEPGLCLRHRGDRGGRRHLLDVAPSEATQKADELCPRLCPQLCRLGIIIWVPVLAWRFGWVSSGAAVVIATGIAVVTLIVIGVVKAIRRRSVKEQTGLKASEMPTLNDLHLAMGELLDESSQVENMMLALVMVCRDDRPMDEVFGEFERNIRDED